MDASPLPEGAALFISPSFLNGVAKERYENNFDLPPDQGGFTTWPQTVLVLLRTFAKDAYIEEALARLDELRQDPDEKEVSYAKRPRKQARRCGSVFREQNMINRFIRGLRADLKPLLRVLRADYGLPNAFQDYVERAGAQGDAHRALVDKTLTSKPGSRSASPMRPKLKTTAPRRPTPARFLEEQGEVFVTQVTDVARARVPTEEFGHIYGSRGTVSESYASDDVYAIQTNRNRRHPAWAQPTQQQRPGWVTYKTNLRMSALNDLSWVWL